MTHKLLKISLIWSLVCGVFAASAEQHPAPVLEEITVTAQKRPEPLQETPISIAAFGEERLQIEGINNLSDLRSLVPSLTVEPFPINNATLRIFIRGIGISDAQITQDPPVGIYLDGVYIARSTGTSMDLADLKRIEVLRGPQGTLYGRNTTGGAINLVTRRPSTEALEFSQRFGIGSRELLSSKTTVNLPINEQWAIKLATLYRQRDGYMENTGPGADFGGHQMEAYRLDVRWQASPRMTLDYAFDHSSQDYGNYQYQHIRPRTPEPGSQASLINAQPSTRYSTARRGSLATVTPFQESHTEIDGHALTVTREFDAFQLKYIGAYRELYDESYADLGGGRALNPQQNAHGIGSASRSVFRLDSNRYCGQAAEYVLGPDQCTPGVLPVVEQEQWSHELQIDGHLFDQRIEYLAGLYYFHEEATEDNGPLHHQLSGPANLNLPDFADTFGQVPLLGGAVGDLLGPAATVRAVNLLSQRYYINNEALAVFGQFTWTPPLWDDRLHLTFGARHTEDDREAVKFQRDVTIIETAATAVDASMALCNDGTRSCRNFDNLRASRTFRDDSFTFISSFDVSDSSRAYLKIAQAYKSGGFNTRDPQRDGNQGPASDGIDYGFGYAEGFAPEYVTSYELGVKSEFLKRRLRLNGDVFFSQYDDMQLNFILDGTVADTKVTNAGEAQMWGMEADISYLPHRKLLLMLSYAYLETDVTKATDVNGNDVSDQFVFFSAPEHSMTLSADFTVHRWDWARLSLNLGMSYTDERNGGSLTENIPNTELRAYQLFNARLTLDEVKLGGGRVGVALWGRNILDEDYEISAVDNLPQADRSVIWGEPASYGAELYFDF